MSESERRQRTISSTPRLTPDEVAARAFPTAFRGISEPDVRAFLKRVSEDLTAARAREQELMTTVDELETRLRSPQPLNEQELLDALGEETTRLLRSAREAATDIRAKAEERAAKVAHDANEDARRVREEAGEVLGLRTTEAEAVAQGLLEEAEQRATDLLRVADERAAELRDSADRYAEDLRSRADHEAAREVDEARERGITLVEEATSLRERVIDDLARRRELLTGQLEELRTGRDRLLDSYRVVKRTFLDATEALAQVEARATGPRPTGDADPADLGAAVASETEAARAAGLEHAEPPQAVTDAAAEPEPAAMAEAGEAEAGAAATDESAGHDGEPDADATMDTGAAATDESAGHDGEPNADATMDTGAAATDEGAGHDGEPDADATVDTEAAANLADVDDLFARLRAGAQADGAADVAAAAAVAGAGEAAAEPGPEPEAEVVIEIESEEIVVTGPEPEPAAEPEIPAWLAARDAAVAPLRAALVRQIKLAIGNEQNEVLDKVRRHKGKVVAANVLPEVDAQSAAWSAVIAAAAGDSYRAAAGAGATLPDDLPSELARAMVEPLRDRLVAAIDGGHEPGETANQVAERIGARYREWKNRSAESSADDVLVGAYARGVYDAVPDGSQLTWSTPPAGCCPDCADNALEPTAKGESFPTGQLYPPAHAGCRCGVTSGEPAALAGAGNDAEPTHST